ncbi:MAG: helix-turn-helix domain-containing protein [Candidatus Tectomicrobia bacterium]|nr:helix-turn-helix domain-containing protein [Candidatus Tectomicrobia bacterium]
MERKTLTVPEVSQILGISRMSAYKAARRGELPVIRVGNQVLVLRSKLEQMMEEVHEEVRKER